jgi:hypothetical protein
VAEPLYFGCWGGTGHHLYAPGGRPMDYYDERARCARALDGGYLPEARSRPERTEGLSLAELYEAEEPQGVARLTHERGRTILALWDRTVDGRRSSHSTFLLPGTLDFGEAVAAAREAFPLIWRRLDAAGVQVRPHV